MQYLSWWWYSPLLIGIACTVACLTRWWDPLRMQISGFAQYPAVNWSLWNIDRMVLFPVELFTRTIPSASICWAPAILASLSVILTATGKIGFCAGCTDEKTEAWKIQVISLSVHDQQKWKDEEPAPGSYESTLHFRLYPQHLLKISRWDISEGMRKREAVCLDCPQQGQKNMSGTPNTQSCRICLPLQLSLCELWCIGDTAAIALLSLFQHI